MRFVIVTGMSGAGRSTSLKMLEDMGYFCVDNLPAALLGQFALLVCAPNFSRKEVAVGMDIRGGADLPALQHAIEQLPGGTVDPELLFLDATDECLIKRYKETRRSHPLKPYGRVDEGIREERQKMSFLRAQADYIIDTTQLLTRDLRPVLEKIFVTNQSWHNLFVTITSFGFKYGIPADCDLVFDARFLPNPFYVSELRPLTGLDAPVREYVMQFDVAREFLQKLTDMINFLIPNYIAEGKTQLVIGIGCTGGKHRSVTIADGLYRNLQKQNPDYGLRTEHRDCGKTHGGEEGSWEQGGGKCLFPEK